MCMLKPEKLRQMLFESIDSIMDSKELYFSNPATDFSRVQKITLRETMLYPMIITNNSNAVEMLDFFPVKRLPSPAALSYRREQLKTDAFEAVFKRFTSKIILNNRYKGLILIACDGTRLNIPYNPMDEDSFVNRIHGRKGFNQLHLNTCYDLLNDCYVDAVIQGYRSMNERQALCQMMSHFEQDGSVLFIADRGYASFNVIAHAINNQHRFLIRIDSSMARKLFHDRDDLLGVESFDITDEIHVGRKRTKFAYAHRNYHRVHRTYDHIEPSSNVIDRFEVRLLKFPISENNTEFILTNLPADQFSMQDIKELYAKRWGIETSYRYLKYAEGLSHIHSLKRNFIHQEIYAKLTAYNFSSAVLKYANRKKLAKTVVTKHVYTVDRTYLIKVCIRFLKYQLKDILNVIKQKKVPVQAGRKFDRLLRRQRADTLNYR